MSAPAIGAGELLPPQEKRNYLNVEHTVRSWLLTGDHKRIAILYLFSVSLFFMIGGIFASLIRLELISPSGVLLESETYNKIFSAHGIVMIFLFLVPSIPAVFGNFFLPIMIGARDLAFPRM
ncbi:MAG TPA: cbb3-type cytochrome c oxidase subunit I, partial [Fimbriimonadaceae bacterium]|nr:cbb3-type cytochrome c oxidase subunit I [Fimbriimonadaceae bacterium]